MMTPGGDVVTTPMVSVIMPVYNGERFLAAALQSIQGQDYRRLEIVVADDGSTDDTASIARACPGVRYVHHRHQGLAATRNAGLTAARGELIAFLDHDDLWPLHKLRVQVEYLVSHPDVDYVVAHLRNFLEPACGRPSWLKPELLEHEQLGFSTGTLLARRAMFDQIGRFDARLTVGDDTDWFARARSAGIVGAVLPDILLLRRIHDRNHTGQTLHLVQATALGILKASLDRHRRRNEALDAPELP
jgi:glycosyltransferase involved in cell wall biosynthesis